MSDPFLDAHRKSPLVYTVSGPSPISIRDQMLRGVTAVHRLLESGEIGPQRALLVIGAGAGGATAALQAAYARVQAILIERASKAFLAQRSARSRWLDPTQYDWPLDHCHAGRLPWSPFHPPLPLNYRTGRADVLSLDWESTLNAEERRLGGVLKVHYATGVSRTDPLSPTPVGDKLRVTLDSGVQVDAGAIIEAMGHGNERCWVKDAGGVLCYEGQPFWGTDQFTSLYSPQHEVLISGSGDGALQDYLRAVTHLGRAIDIAVQCDIPQTILAAVQSAEDRAHRGRSWVCDDDPVTRRRHEERFLWELDEVHRSQADRALRNPFVIRGLGRLFPAQSVPVPVTIVFPEPYLSCYYGLNRFLTWLLSTYLDERFKRRTLYPGCKIDRTDSAPPGAHTCMAARGPGGVLHANGVYSAQNILVSHVCFEKLHDVQFVATTAMASLPTLTQYNVIIVRHGIEASPPPLQRSRHLLNYHQP
jgi:protein-L-isoaspartate O-methyltransferase